jgi:hypothetical protein
MIFSPVFLLIGQALILAPNITPAVIQIKSGAGKTTLAALC